jgi:MFS family permease
MVSMTNKEQTHDLLSLREVAWVFFAFAVAYFLSALLRAITATLSPTLSVEFGLHARDLGLLAGGYFLGFSMTQLPLGHWLDAHGPKKVVLRFLAMAVVGCLAFALATNFIGLFLSRMLIGAGVSACLMAPLTGYRRWLTPDIQQRANSWMLMTGSFGMLASTLPVQWLLPTIGWRWMFAILAVLLLLAMGLMVLKLPEWRLTPKHQGPEEPAKKPSLLAGYAQVWRNPYFQRMTPIGFFNYGGLIAMQTLWAGPWMAKVAGYSSLEAAGGLFWINVSMLFTFLMWGLVTPKLYLRGLNANRLIAVITPLNLLVQVSILWAGPEAGALHWALFCISGSVVSLAQPAVGGAFPATEAGKGLSGYNLVIFMGVFCVQWGFGLLIDMFRNFGLEEVASFQSALAVFLSLCVVSYIHFVRHKTER